MPKSKQDGETVAVWRETQGRHADPTGVTAHAVGGDQTLCGLPGSTAPWRDTGRGTRCTDCSRVLNDQPLGYQEITDAVGLSYRTLHYWSKKGFVNPTNPSCGTGKQMTWPASEVLIAQVMHVLVGAGVEPAAAARAARNEGVLGVGVRVVVDLDDVQLGHAELGKDGDG